MIYKVELSTNTPQGPLLIESKRTYYMEGNADTLEEIGKVCLKHGWSYAITRILISTPERIDESFSRHVARDLEF